MEEDPLSPRGVPVNLDEMGYNPNLDYPSLPAQAGPTMPAQFDHPGLRFAYPENWRIEPAEETGPLRSVTVMSPGTAYWSVNIYPAESSPANLVEAAAAALQEEYREVEIEDVAETYAGREMAGCDMRFQYLDLTNTASVRWFREPRSIYLLVWQAEDREYDALSPVFEAMTVSLLQGTSR